MGDYNSPITSTPRPKSILWKVSKVPREEKHNSHPRELSPVTEQALGPRSLEDK